MPPLSIVKLPASALRKPSSAVPTADIASPRIRRLISEMKKILSQAPDGVGLAAPQVAAPLRIFIVSDEAAQVDANIRMSRLSFSQSKKEVEDPRFRKAESGHTNDTDKKKELGYFVFINPVLKKQSRGKIAMAEGCLSVPGKFGEVARAEKVYLEWLDERGKKHSRGFSKFFARVIQHEMDHLEGILISDRARKMMSISSGAQQEGD